MPDARSPLKLLIILFAAMAAAAFLVFGHVLISHGFVYDDRYLILDNPYLRDWKYNLLFWAKDVTQTSSLQITSGYYRPLSMTALQLFFHLFGFAAWKYHAVSIFLHALNSFLTGMLAWKISKDMRMGFAAAFIFVLHPVHVEAVVPIYNYMGLLSAAGALLCAVFYLQAVETKKSFFSYAALTAYAAALFCKEDALLIPVFLFFITSDDFKKRCGTLIPYAAMAALYLIFRKLAVEHSAAFGFWQQESLVNLDHPGSWTGHLLGILMTLAGYFKLWIWPKPLAGFHVIAAPQSFLQWCILGAWTAALVLAVWKSRRIWALRLGWIWCGAALFLISNVIPIGGMFYERLLYLPSAGLAWITAWMMVYGLDALPRPWRGITAAAAAAVLVFGGSAAAAYSFSWQTNDQIWGRAHQIYPASAYPLDQLGKAFYDAGDLTTAAAYYKQAAALERNPEKQVMMRRKAAQAYGTKRLFPEAILQYKVILSRHPAYWQGWFELGWTYALAGDLKAAETTFRDMLARNPSAGWAYYGLAELAFSRGDTPGGRALCNQALQAAPEDRLLVQTILQKLGSPDDKK